MQAPPNFLKAAACDIFHAEERQPIVALANIVNRQNIRMIQVCGRFGFAPETHQHVI
jgi:hypothetical protein